MDKINAKKVTINWKEGTQNGKYPMSFNSIKEANRQILRNSQSAPKSGGYDKHSIVIEWADGEIYTARLDVKHPSQPNPDLNIGQHIKQFLDYYIKNPNKPEDVKEYKEYLAKYDLEL